MTISPTARPRRGSESLNAAGALFRRHGVDGVGVDAIMDRAGLTHGGFYGHFASKEALVAEVCADELGHSAARWADMAGQPDAFARIVAQYLRLRARRDRRGRMHPGDTRPGGRPAARSMFARDGDDTPHGGYAGTDLACKAVATAGPGGAFDAGRRGGPGASLQRCGVGCRDPASGPSRAVSPESGGQPVPIPDAALDRIEPVLAEKRTGCAGSR